MKFIEFKSNRGKWYINPECVTAITSNGEDPGGRTNVYTVEVDVPIVIRENIEVVKEKLEGHPDY